MTRPFKPDDSDSLLQFFNHAPHSRTAFDQHKNAAFIESEFQVEDCKRHWKEFKGTPEISGISLS